MESGWHEYVPKIVHAFNCTKSESRRYSLFLLLFRRSLRLPIAIIFGTSSEGAAGEYSDYVKRWKTAMTEAYALAAEKARLSATKGKPFQDRKAQTWTLGTKFLHGTHQSVEDRVNRVHTGKTRFTLWWLEKGTALSMKGKPRGEVNRTAFIHRRMLLPRDLLLLLPQITHLLLNEDSREHQCRCYF